MTKLEIEDIANVLQGYESWKVARMHAIENGSDDQLSVSAYLDEYAKARALDILAQIQAVYANTELTWQEVDAEIRNLIGVQ
jgi:hypothetical protein